MIAKIWSIVSYFSNKKADSFDAFSEFYCTGIFGGPAEWQTNRQWLKHFAFAFASWRRIYVHTYRDNISFLIPMTRVSITFVPFEIALKLLIRVINRIPITKSSIISQHVWVKFIYFQSPINFSTHNYFTPMHYGPKSWKSKANRNLNLIHLK